MAKWFGLAILLLQIMGAPEARAGACMAARTHDYQDLGCNKNFPGLLGAYSPLTCCPTGCGMPRWSVSEPYINLHISDVPLLIKPRPGRT